MRLATIGGAAVAAAVLTAAAGAAVGGACSSRCGFEVSTRGFVATGVGARGRSLSARVGATVVWRLKLVRLGQTNSHTVSSDAGFFRSPLLRNRVGDAIFWRRVTSAGRFAFHDSVGRAGSGVLVVLPVVHAARGGVRAVWAVPGSNLGNAYDVRYEVIEGVRTVARGSLYEATFVRSRTFVRGERLGRSRLVRGRILCVEVRSGLIGEGWSDWTRGCEQV